MLRFPGSALLVLLSLIWSASTTTFAALEPRESLPLANWEFAVEEKVGQVPQRATWTPVVVPHVFRQSGLPDDAVGWYRLMFTTTAADRGRRIFLRLEGAASVKSVFVNGQAVGQHKGAFTAAVFDLTPGVRVGQSNSLEVRVSNRDDEVAGALSRGANLYYVNGGLFRKAWLVKTGAVHLFPEMGSSGVFLTPCRIASEKADMEVRTVVRNSESEPVAVKISHKVTAPSGEPCAEFAESATVPAGETVSVSGTGVIPQPKLWDLGKPNLYTVRTELQVRGDATDAVTERTGIRTIEYKKERFFLNGREVQFQGVNKHAQNETAWNAVNDSELRQEWDLMTAMGVNTVRLSHYPHSSLEYALGDERGIAIWAENGFAGRRLEGDPERQATPDGERLTREMVRQHWNHPSILFWSGGNETVVDAVARYAEVISEEDTTRLVTYGGDSRPAANCDFAAWNTYDGWYEGSYTDFAKLPRNRSVSETGCGDWLTHHVPYGTVEWKVDQFEPEEYAEIFTEFRLQTVFRNDSRNRCLFLWWNFREFYNKKFKENRNTKGLVTLGGAPKDIYFAFQAFMARNQPVLHLCGRQHFYRQFAPDNGIKAYSNAPELELFVNGVSRGTLKNGLYRIPDAVQKTEDGGARKLKGIPVENVFFWKTPLDPGRNSIIVKDPEGRRDEIIVYQKPGTGGVETQGHTREIVQNVHSSNPKTPAVFIDRPVEAEGAFYSDVDGSSDNTFDTIPEPVKGASWIATRRLSDSTNKTDLSFQINPESRGAAVFVLFSKGTFPTVTLKQPDVETSAHAVALTKSLAQAGFADTKTDAVWRDHQLNRADARLWCKQAKPGEHVEISGETLDYVILLKPLPADGHR